MKDIAFCITISISRYKRSHCRSHITSNQYLIFAYYIDSRSDPGSRPIGTIPLGTIIAELAPGFTIHSACAFEKDGVLEVRTVRARSSNDELYHHVFANNRSLSLSLSLTLSLSISFSVPIPLSNSLTIFLTLILFPTLYPSLSLSHTHTHSLSHTHTHPPSLSHSISLSHTRPHSNTHSLSVSLSLTHTQLFTTGWDCDAVSGGEVKGGLLGNWVRNWT